MPTASRSGRNADAVWIALLRGINLGGRNRLPMKDLVVALSAAGCTDVRTYIQSGNVVFRARPAVARRVPGVVAELTARLGFHAAVMTRTADALRDVARSNPFLRAGAAPEGLHVAFLADAPSAARVAALDPSRSPPDAFEVRGREIYLHCPNGFGRTKLGTDYFDAKLATTSTVRNWRTVLTLLALADETPSSSEASRPEPVGSPASVSSRAGVRAPRRARRARAVRSAGRRSKR
jgi:uncharacterized protein (DUF1697 family)